MQTPAGQVSCVQGSPSSHAASLPHACAGSVVVVGFAPGLRNAIAALFGPPRAPCWATKAASPTSAKIKPGVGVPGGAVDGYTVMNKGATFTAGSTIGCEKAPVEPTCAVPRGTMPPQQMTCTRTGMSLFGANPVPD